ncbi:MAG: neutral zinc metallopeptidase [Archangiaceae bacterium]|nr:neutral zinc metallopeptidase [Archangiaceae bacterium]
MKWEQGHQSNDVEDRRGQGPGFGGGRGVPLGLLAMIGSRWGIGAALLAALAFGAFQYLGSARQEPAVADRQVSDQQGQFASFVLDDVQTTWAAKLPGYRKAKMVLFSGQTNTGCGFGDSAVGPFYCPEDGKVYLDTEFFSTLEGKLGASGDFAQAYVIAHEIGHHVQNLKGGVNPGIKTELQADCYAGVWAASTAQRKLLENGDLQEAFTATAAIGDDRLQKRSTGTVRPEKWTHGSSAQRTEAFKRGLEGGDPEACERTELSELER